jgi:hypothetical protein
MVTKLPRTAIVFTTVFLIAHTDLLQYVKKVKVFRCKPGMALGVPGG